MRQTAIIVFGLPGSGKTFFAEKLSEQHNFRHISSDLVRKEITPNPTYSEEEKASIYAEMLERFRSAMGQGTTVVVDATFSFNSRMLPFIEAAQNADVPLLLFEIYAEEDVLRERLQQKRKDSDADVAVHEKLKDSSEDLGLPAIRIKSSRNNINEMLAEANKQLTKKND